MAQERIFRFEDRRIGQKYSFKNDTRHLPHDSDLKHLHKSLLSLIGAWGTQKNLLDNGGYVIALEGSYGAGKTTAARALVDELKESQGAKVFELYHTFLPFSNPNEAITVFLNKLTDSLWRSRFVDIRRDIQQFILEVTPENTRLNAGINIGWASVSWPVMAPKNTHDGVNSAISTKLARVIYAQQAIVVTLDDLDRLEPNQIVAIMRMVEKLRALPRVIIILPIFKDVVRNAFIDQFKIDISLGSALMRKLIDFEVKIRNRLTDLEKVFKEGLVGARGIKAGAGLQDLSWNILLHNIIIAEAYDQITKEKNGGAEKWEIIRKSPYLSEVRQIFDHHRYNRPKLAEPYLTYYVDNDGKSKFAPLGRNYDHFVEMGDNINGPRQLSDLREREHVMRPVITDEALASQYKDTGEYVNFDKEIETKNSEAALTNFFIPILRSSKHEPLLTDNYKLRDMAILARNISGNRKFDPTIRDIGKLYDLIREEYDNFR